MAMRLVTNLRLRIGSPFYGVTAAVLAAVAGWMAVGCGTPGAPQAPSLRLPEPVTDLSAVRAGQLVTLRWTMPRKTTDRLPLSTQVRGPIPARICQSLQSAHSCVAVGQAAFSPSADAVWEYKLPAEMITGEARQVTYEVELLNKSGQTAGPSNAAVIVAGAAPPAIEGLRAEARADGVAISWQRGLGSSGTGQVGSERAGSGLAVRLHRTLLNPPAVKDKKDQKGSGGGLNLSGNSGDAAEPLERSLLVDSAAGIRGALDTSARFGSEYAYTAQGVEKLTLEGKEFELDGAISTPIRVNVVDTFPPLVPEGLAAVAVQEEKSIDLSWQPDTENDLAGYFVYRTVNRMPGDSGRPGATEIWTRISGDRPLAGPAYRDSTAEGGRIYRYAVTAIDLTGHESKRSTEAEETLAKP